MPPLNFFSVSCFHAVGFLPDTRVKVREYAPHGLNKREIVALVVKVQVSRGQIPNWYSLTFWFLDAGQ